MGDRGWSGAEDVVAAVAARYGVPGERVRAAPAGEANHVFLLGDRLVLRFPRTVEFVVDLVKEAAVIPAVRRVGVRTPEVVAFDDSCSIVDTPYLVLVRAPGVDLARLGLSVDDARPVFRDVGRELAALHRIGPAELAGVPADDGAGDPRVLVGRLSLDGWIDAAAADWLTGWFDRLEPRLPPDPPQVLVHGDISPTNLLVAPAGATLTGIVDWGDARWADPATDFAKLPPTALPAVLDGYRDEPDAGDWAARILWHHLVWALGRLADPVARPGLRHWTAPPASRLLGLLRFFASNPPSPWRELG